MWIQCSCCEHWQHAECEVEFEGKGTDADWDMREVCLDLINAKDDVFEDDEDDGPEYWCRECRKKPECKAARLKQ